MTRDLVSAFDAVNVLPPLLVERLNNRLSNESVLDRVQRLIAEATKAEL
ncbi:MAG: hypothetical protein RLZZ32_1049 [Cyanobacteriota bacterium]|jgi:hypothetical protein